MKLNYKIYGSTVTAISLYIALLWCANDPSVSPVNLDFILHITFILAGTSLGWLIGIIASPYGEKEKEHFSNITKGITVFFTGYALAKIDPLVNSLLNPDALLSPIIGFRALAFFIAFILALIITFIYRRYAK